MGKKAPDPPDYGPLAAVTERLGNRQMELQEEVFDWGVDYIERQEPLQLAIQEELYAAFQQDTARQQYAFDLYREFYEPLAAAEQLKDIDRSDTAYQQSQADRQRFLEDADRARAYEQEDRRFLTETARPLQLELIEEERQRAAEDQQRRQAIVDLSIGEYERQIAQAEDFAQRYRDEFQPFESEFAETLRTWDTPERQRAAAGAAMSEVGQAFQAERENAERRLASYGVDPSMLRGQAIDLGVRVAEASAQAQAAAEARRRVEDQGIQYGAAAVDIGRGTQALGQAASEAGTRAAAITPATLSNYRPSADGLAPGTGGASGALGAATALSSTAYDPRYSALGAGSLPGQAGLAGTSPALLTGAAGVGNQFLGAGSQALTAPVAYGNSAINAFGTSANIQNLGFQNELQAAALNQQPLIAGMGLAGNLLGGFGFSEGGEVSRALSPSRGAMPDDVPAALEAGEFVIPRDVVEWEGLKSLHGLIGKAREKRGEALAMGGR